MSDSTGGIDAKDGELQLLAPFASLNPEATVTYGADRVTVEKPWGDDSLTMGVPVTDEEAIAALNSVRLPPRLSALWHQDSNDLELIFTITRRNDDIRSRAFVFSFEGQEFRCEYADASTRLLAIGGITEPSGTSSSTDHRNLPGVRHWLRLLKSMGEGAFRAEHVLSSFFIRDVRVDEDRLLTLGRHLNFYMYYFDRLTPRLAFHHPDETAKPAAPFVRYPMGPFPGTIVSRDLDSYLLGLWDSALTTAEPMRRFIYFFQVLEYAAFYYVKEEIQQKVRRIVAASNLPSLLDDASRQILELMAEDKLGDDQKMDNVVLRAVDPAAVWQEIAQREKFFSDPTAFDGGVVVPALIKAGWTVEDFRAAWFPKVPDLLRRIRNAVVHSRERRQATCIPPTRNNQRLIRPWTAVAAAVAAQVVIYDM